MAQPVKIMTSKDLNLALNLKDGDEDGVSYLMRRFSFNDEEALFTAIHRVTPNHSQWFIKELQKKRRRKQKNITYVEVPDTASEVVTEMTEEPKTQTDVKEEEKVVELDSLLQEEEELSISLQQLEVLHKEEVEKRRNIVYSFESEKKAISRIQEELRERENVVRKLYEEYEQCANEMHKLNQDMQVQQQLLTELRSEIAELRKVVVFVYDTGEIEAENAEIPQVSEEQVKSELDKLLSLPEAEEVTIRNVRSIARVKLILPELSSDVELIFDSEKVQALYEATK